MDRGGETWRLRLLCLAASACGLLLIFSATRYDPALRNAPWKQGAALGLGLLLSLLLPRVDLAAAVDRLWPLLAAGSGLLLLLLIPLGREDGTGNRSWISLPGNVFHIQPAEFVKLSFVLLLALQLSRASERRALDRPATVLGLAAHGLSLCGLLYAVSGDLGMAAVYGAVYLVMLWVSGMRPLWLLAHAAAGAGAAAFLWPRLPDYVRLRFLVVLDHDLDPLGKGFQQGRSLLAIGSGRLLGQGYLQGIQTQSPSPASLPARHTDFIFSVAGEEFGLAGCGLLLLLLAAIVWRCAGMARSAQDGFSALAAAGIAAIFGVQTVLNVGMCLYAAPVIGVTLPFLSFGGSSVLSGFLAVGILGALERRGPEKARRRRIGRGGGTG